jgi:methyltransferase-like protein
VTEANPFDEVAYATRPYSESHPDHLGLLAYLHGLDPPSAERCRVLEVGCGSGDNLAPLALAYPESQFVGIDLSAAAINRARDMAQACGLKNLDFRQQDLLEAGADIGPFDYIIAHGFYSWVPAAVRDRLLELCGACLSAHGVAFVSYAVFPGAHQRQMVREVLLHHAGDASAGRQRLDRAKEMLAFLVEAAPKTGTTYRLHLEDEAKLLARSGDGNYLHDNLSTANDPVYFHQFLEHARRHRLQFLTDVAFIPPLVSVYPPAVLERLRQLCGGDRLALQQYRDFLEGRMFRETLLCRADAAPDPAPRPERVRELWAMSSARPAAGKIDLRSPTAEQFRIASGAVMDTSHPLAKAALCLLGEAWPEALRFDALLAQARTRRGDLGDTEQDAEDLAAFLLVANGIRFVRLMRRPPDWLRIVSDKPATTALVRWQAAAGLPITNAWRQSIPLDDQMLRYLLGLLDGTRRRPALVKALVEHGIAHQLVLMNGRPLEDPRQVHELLEVSLEANLKKFAQLCLLVG